jgi:hypothetical protein
MMHSQSVGFRCCVYGSKPILLGVLTILFWLLTDDVMAWALA